MRFLALLAIVATALTIADASVGRARPATACSIGVEPLEAVIQRASPIVLARAVSVGGAANPLPEVTTLPPTIVGPSVFPTRTPTDLTGIGGMFDVIRVFSGEAQSPLAVDADRRTQIERTVRQLEALPWDQYPPCEAGLGVARYIQGAEYYLFLDGDSPLGTVSFRKVGDEVVLGDPASPNDTRYLTVSAATYDRFFSAYAAELDGDFAYIRADRIAAADLEAAVKWFLRPASITPPNTGSAGLLPNGGLR